MATSRQVWLHTRRLAPTVDFALLRETPLTFLGTFRWVTPRKRRRHSRVHLRMDADGSLTARGVPLIHGRERRRVAGASDDAAIIVLMVEESAPFRFGRPVQPSEGIEVLLRSGELSEGLRASVARSAAAFGLSAENFASLAWADERGQF